MNNIVIKNIEPQSIKISGAGEVIGITAVYVNGVNVTEGSVAYVIVPTKTSELVNNSGFITEETDPTIPYYIKQIRLADITRWNNKQDELVSGVNIKTVNSNSLLGSGNIDISTSYSAGTGIEITEENVINNTITSYDDLTDLPTIPTKISDLTNDSDFVESTSLAEVAFNGSYLALSNTPDSTSDFTNDGENGIDPFITNKTNSLENYYNIDYMWNILPHVTDSDTNINLSPTVSDTTLKMSLDPSTLSQDGTPTPDSPQNIHTISGSNKVVVANALNLLNMKEYAEENSTYFTYSFETGLTAIAKDNRASANVGYPINVEASTTYYIKTDTDKRLLVSQYNSSNGWLANNEVFNGDSFTTNANASYIRVKVADTLSSFPTLIGNVCISKSNNYISQEADIDLDFEYCKIGNYEDKFIRNSGKNLFDSSITPENYYYDNNGEKVYQSGVEYINQEINNINYTSITISFLSNIGGASVRVCEYNLSGAFITRTLVNTNNQVVNLNNATTKIILSVNSDSNYYFNYLMINEGTTALPYEPYGSNEWYIKKNIGKKIYQSSDITNMDWLTYQNLTYFRILKMADSLDYNNYNSSSTLFDKYVNTNEQLGWDNANYIGKITSRANSSYYWIGVAIGTDLATYRTQVGEITSYYILATPTYTQITGDLAEQLDTIEDGLKAYNEQTNISQVNADLPFVINADTLKSLANL